MRKVIIAAVAAVAMAPALLLATSWEVAYADVCSAQAAANPGAGALCEATCKVDGTCAAGPQPPPAAPMPANPGAGAQAIPPPPPIPVAALPAPSAALPPASVPPGTVGPGSYNVPGIAGPVVIPPGYSLKPGCTLQDNMAIADGACLVPLASPQF
jgi:hypothetical protein